MSKKQNEKENVKKSAEVEDGYKKIGGFDSEFIKFDEAGVEFKGTFVEEKTVEKDSKFAKKGKKVSVRRFFFTDDEGKKWQTDERGNLAYLFDEAKLQGGEQVKIVYNGKIENKKDKKAYHNYELFIKG